MKKMLILISISLLFVSFSNQIFSQDVEKNTTQQEVCIEDLKKDRDNLKKKEIPEFEKKIIESDEELKNLRDKIKELDKELSSKLKTKLLENKEYQELQKRLKDIETKIKELEKKEEKK
mgnify:CR=1 FL=1